MVNPDSIFSSTPSNVLGDNGEVLTVEMLRKLREKLKSFKPCVGITVNQSGWDKIHKYFPEGVIVNNVSAVNVLLLKNQTVESLAFYDRELMDAHIQHHRQHMEV